MDKRGAPRDRVLVDLHLHSRASGTASNWWVRGLGAEVEARESYTLPEEAYRMAKRAGMDFVTLTDHETIEGGLTLAHRPDFFVGEEVSAYLPEEGGYVDVLVYGIDEEVHREAQARRDSVNRLVDYLREAGVAHVLAHPRYGMPGPLDRRAIEKRLGLFGLWEFINGLRSLASSPTPTSSSPGSSSSSTTPQPGRTWGAAREFAEGMSWEAVLDGLTELHSRLAGSRPSSDVYARS